MTRRLVARLWRCEDPECDCVQPALMEMLGDEEVERIWEGTYLHEASPAEMEMLRDELAEVAHKHRLEQDDWDPDVWSREI